MKVLKLLTDLHNICVGEKELITLVHVGAANFRITVIPKIHKENVYELTPDIARHIFEAVPKIASAIKAEYNPIGLNTLNNNGEHAGQSVFHFHMHLIPRYGKEDGFGAVWKTHESDYTPEELQKIAASINQHL